MYLETFIVKGSSIYKLRINGVHTSELENEHRIIINNAVVDDAAEKIEVRNEVNIKFNIVLPKGDELNYAINTVKGIINGINTTKEKFETLAYESSVILYVKNLKNKQAQKEHITLKDVILNDSVMNKLKQTLQFLNKTDKYSDIGAKMPKNILLYGPPGTGKTLIAKALGHESGRSLYTASAAEFADKYVGVGPRRIRELFEKAKNDSPSIIFIDEIDCIAMKRSDKTNSEDLKMLNQLLTELDGINDNKDITIICATNRADILDPAFIRTGRFDRKIKIEEPDYNNRVKMFKLYLNKVKHNKNIDVELLAEITEGCNGSDISNIVNESAILAVDKNLKKVSMNELREKAEELMNNKNPNNLKVKANTIGF